MPHAQTVRAESARRVRPDCRLQTIKGPGMQPIYDWFREFYERTGINLNFIYDDFDRARMIRASS